MRKFAILFCLFGSLAFAGAADYPLGDYVELEDARPVDNAAWDALADGLFFTWGSKDIRYSYKNVPDVEFRTDTAIYAWRGERISALALIYSKHESKELQLSLSDFVRDGKSIPTGSSANFVNYVMTDELNKDGKGACGYRPDKTKFDSSMVADVIDKQLVKDLKARRVRPVWCSFEVPRDIEPGDYDVTLKLKRGRSTLGTLNITIHVLDKTLPEPSDYAFNVDIWQQPYSVSRYYKVPKWSDEHFEAMRPMMKALARAGQKSISTEIIYEPWGDQSHDKFDPMIETVKKRDGSWSYDYTVFDKWVQFMMDCGIDKEIKCFSMVPWDMSFRYYDEATGGYKFLSAQTTSQDYKDFWIPLLTNFVAHLKEKGWYDITTICMDERGIGAMMDAYNLLQSVAPGMRMSLAGSYHKELVDKLDYYSLQYAEPFTKEQIAARKAAGQVSTMYMCCSSAYPNANTFSAPAEATCMPLHAVQRGFEGILRWAYNNWSEDPLRDTRYRMFGAGDMYMIYPGFRSSVRFERFIEGVQDAEKIRILRDEYRKSGNTEALELLESKVGTFGEGKIDKDNAAKLVRDLERVLNGEPLPPVPPRDSYCEVGLSESGKSAAIQKRWLKSVSTIGAGKNLSYTSSLPSSNGYVISSKIEAEQGSSFTLNAKAATNDDDIRYTRAAAYADWNCDKIFNTYGNEVVGSFGKPNSGTTDMLDLTANFNVPSNAVIGESRIRIRYADAWDAEPDPCGNNVKGFTFDIPLLITASSGIAANIVDGNADYTYSGGIFNFPTSTEVVIFSSGGAIVCHERNIYSLKLDSYIQGSYIVKIKQGGKTGSAKIVL